MNKLTSAKAIKVRLEEQISGYKTDAFQLHQDMEKLQSQLNKTLGALEYCKQLAQEIK